MRPTVLRIFHLLPTGLMSFFLAVMFVCFVLWGVWIDAIFPEDSRVGFCLILISPFWPLSAFYGMRMVRVCVKDRKMGGSFFVVLAVGLFLLAPCVASLLWWQVALFGGPWILLMGLVAMLPMIWRRGMERGKEEV